MLVILEQKNRTNGVKEYLVEGEKVNDSKYHKKSGLSEYLNKGKTGDRDIKDQRIPLVGDLTVLDEVIKMATSKGTTESYRNFVLSFEEDNISTKHLKEITQSFIDNYMIGYQSDEYTCYAEAHRPKIKYKIENDKRVKRHLHIHLSIAKYSAKHDRLLDLGHHGDYVKTGGRLKEIEIWKKLIEQRYGLKSTQTNPISIGENYKNKTLQETREGLILFCKNKSQMVNNLDELIDKLQQFDFIDSIKKSKNARTPYIAIKLDDGKTIRLKGTLFSDKSFHNAQEKLTNQEKEYVYSESKEPREVEIPKEFIKLQELRADKVHRDMEKVRAKHQDILSDLQPLEMSDDYKNWIRKNVYKNEVVSQLSFKVKDIKSKHKNRVNLNDFNQKLDGRVLLHILKDSHSINEEIYHPYCTKEGDYRIVVGTHKYSLSEFLQKHMNFSWEETVKTLSYVYKHQTKFQQYINTPRKNIYQRMSYQNKVFIDIYSSHTSLDLSSFYITQKDEVTTLKKGGIEIEDIGDVLQSKYTQDVQTQVKFMLELAKAKEWDIEEVEIEGDEEFKNEVQRQLREQKVDNKEKIKPRKRKNK